MVLPQEVVLAQSWERELARFQLNRFYRKLFNVEASHLAHCCTIFLKSSGYRNIAQGGDPLYAAVDYK